MYDYILALSPVGAGFLTDVLSVLGGEGKLTYQHADFVDAIHTSCDSFGTTLRVGHADFYPNGGVTQPGCGGVRKKITMFSFKILI